MMNKLPGKIITNTLLFLMCLFFYASSAAQPLPLNFRQTPIKPYTNCDIVHLLGWIPAHNICGGRFQESPIIAATPQPPAYNEAMTTITAEQTVFFSATGTSSLSGQVTLTQPGRQIIADRASLYRDPQTEKITQLFLEGNVHFMEHGKHLVAQSVFVDLNQKFACLTNVMYRLAKHNRDDLNAWGTASSVKRLNNGELILTQGNYTTCSPCSITWQLAASQIRINRERGWGDAYNTQLYIHSMPIFWFPYFSFPVDKRRKTGFLFPTFAYSNDQGFYISFPYYLNLAPNYDAVIAPTYLFRRGLQLETRIRYLTCSSSGRIYFEFMPYDPIFAKFRREAPSIYGVNENTLPFLNRLDHASNSRGLFSFDDTRTYNPHLWSTIHLSLVTDDYYLQDFAANPFRSSLDQLLNQLELNYAADYWRGFARLQTFQSLHPINQQPVLDQYLQLPKVFLTSYYPTYPNRFSVQFNGEYVYFDHRDNFITHEPVVTGQRIHAQPLLTYPLLNCWSFLIPTLKLDLANYNLNHQPNNQPENISRVLPIFDIDSGFYLEKHYAKFTQTLEPRFFYLYVPVKNQNDIPIFDTTLPPFSLEQLFRTNRFVGYDRIGDANQISYALTTRLLSTCSGIQRVRASIGQVLYFHKPEVCLTPDCFNQFHVDKRFSPAVAELNYYLSSCWDAMADVAVDSDDGSLNNFSLNLHYHPSRTRIFNVGYDFVRNGDLLQTYALNSSQNNLSRINIATAWQLSERWQVMANLNYNLSHGHPETYFYGFVYNSCCWALRFVASRMIVAENINDVATFQTNFYVQLQLKGLGNIGISDPGTLLSTSIFGYHDIFRG